MKKINKYKLKMLNNIDGTKFDWADYRKELENFKVASLNEMKELFVHLQIGRISLKYLDLKTKKPNFIEISMEAEYFTTSHFEWLTSPEWSQVKYIQLESLDMRLQSRKIAA